MTPQIRKNKMVEEGKSNQFKEGDPGKENKEPRKN